MRGGGGGKLASVRVAEQTYILFSFITLSKGAKRISTMKCDTGKGKVLDNNICKVNSEKNLSLICFTNICFLIFTLILSVSKSALSLHERFTHVPSVIIPIQTSEDTLNYC